MTDDQMIRGAATAAATVVYWLLFSKPRARPGAEREPAPFGSSYRIGRWLGNVWAKTRSRIKKG
jgi:hypothetical protein